MILASPPPFLIHKCRQMPRPPGPLRQSREGPSQWRAAPGPYPLPSLRSVVGSNT